MNLPQICRLLEKFQFDCVRHKLFFGLYLHILHVKSVWYNVFDIFFYWWLPSQSYTLSFLCAFRLYSLALFRHLPTTIFSKFQRCHIEYLIAQTTQQFYKYLWKNFFSDPEQLGPKKITSKNGKPNVKTGRTWKAKLANGTDTTYSKLAWKFKSVYLL